jgi:hypothetical protein
VVVLVILGGGFLQICHTSASCCWRCWLLAIALWPLYRACRAPSAPGLARPRPGGAHIPKWRIVYVLVVGPLFGLLSLFLLWFGQSEGETAVVIIGVIGLLLAAGLTWAGIAMWRKRQAFERNGG